MQLFKTAPHNRFCLVSIQIGDIHANYWKLLFQKSWHEYARRHQYDILIIDQLIDGSSCAPGQEISPALAKFQKLSIPGLACLQDYQKIVYLDADIFLTPSAPCLAQAVPDGLAGMVNEMQVPYPEWFTYIQPLRGAYQTAEAYFQNNLLPEEVPKAAHLRAVYNSGLIVLQPHLHAPVFNEIRQAYARDLNRRQLHVDQPILNLELQTRHLIHPLDHRWNLIFSLWFALHYRFIDETNETAMRQILETMLPLFHAIHFPSMRGAQFLPARYFTLPVSNTN